MANCDVAIIGAGVMGAAAASEVARRGAKVALIDQSVLPNPRAASVDHSRVFRYAYPDPFYVKLAIDALKRWRSLEEETGKRLLTETGALLIGKHRPSFETECWEGLRAAGLDAELLESTEVGARFPQFNPDAVAFAVFDPSGAIIGAEASVRTLLDLARHRGVSIIEGERIVAIKQSQQPRTAVINESGDVLNCARVMIASGPWTRELLPSIADELTTTRQEVVYFEPTRGTPSDTSERQLSFDVGRFPIFSEFGTGFYGFPIHHGRAMKLANHHKGQPVAPYSFDEEVGDQFIERCRAFFAEFIPALADAQVRQTRMCMYNNTPDDDFIIDWHPGLKKVLVVTGFSGHGFKFAPTIGHIAADLLLSGRTSYDVDRLRLSRFNNT